MTNNGPSDSFEKGREEITERGGDAVSKGKDALGNLSDKGAAGAAGAAGLAGNKIGSAGDTVGSAGQHAGQTVKRTVTSRTETPNTDGAYEVKKKRNIWPWLLLLLLVLLALIALIWWLVSRNNDNHEEPAPAPSTSASSQTPAAAAPGPRHITEVTYEATSSNPMESIKYYTDGAFKEDKDLPAKWSKPASLGEGAKQAVMTITTEGGPTTCKIVVDGKVLQEVTKNNPGKNIVTCSLPVK